jgi:hypothetical protein
MLKRIRNSYITKGLALCLAFNLIAEIVFPTIAFGLTSGPIDINQASFEPAATSEMVNLATGDFTYNIPLMDVDGYPINIAYHGGVNMDQEASMVGLGWSLNVGAMNRMKRGLPDDFKGDEIVTEINLRPRESMGGSIRPNLEIFGKEKEIDHKAKKFGVNVGISFNNYSGYGLDFSARGFDIGIQGSFYSAGLGVGLESSQQNGLSINPYGNAGVGFSGDKRSIGATIGIGTSWNSVQGLQNINMQAGMRISGPIGHAGGSFGNTVPISTVTYTPSVAFEHNLNIKNFDFDIGIEKEFSYPHMFGSFYSSLNCLKENIQTSKAYGYLYEEQHNPFENFLLDFNRDGVVIPNEHIAYLPITNHTFDVYSATAQGVGFNARPFRSDILTVSEPTKQDDINGLGLSGEVGVGVMALELGANIHLSSGFVQTGKWDVNNQMDEEFVPKVAPSALYEKTYFKKLGNRSGSNSDFYSDLGGNAPLKQEINPVTHNGEKKFISNFNPETSSPEDYVYAEQTFNSGNHYREEREARNTNIQYLTAGEAQKYGFDAIKSHSINDFDYSGSHFSATTLSRFGTTSTEVKEHHLDEMTVLEGDGSRYVYGIPVVNHVTNEVTFNISQEFPTGLGTPYSADCQTGLITYDDIDNSPENRRGDNNLYLKKTIPASVNSHLLSAYLQSNYIDRTGNGPTPDDLGSYTKFNYSKMAQPTKWRIPFEENKAAFNEGLKSDEYDDMASYVYGERDQWYLHSIESKNFVAVFEYGDRHDGYGVKDENGGRAEYNNSKRLVSISLYSRIGLENGEDPIKTVHFEYNYDLCGNVPNNDGTAVGVGETGVSDNDQHGKLTLTGIYFTYGASKRGKLHKYKFDYGMNPSYSPGKVDRWGSYQENPAGSSCDPDDPLSNLEFPYAVQDKTVADENANAWMLNSIHLPTGSRIDIEVESDDYSYLMEKKPSKMYKIRGMSNGGDADGSDIIYSIDGDRNYIHVELDDPILAPIETAKKIFEEEYLGDLEVIYFKYLVCVSSKDQILLGAEKYEYVSGYAEIDRTNIYVKNEVGDPGDPNYYDTGLIRLKTVHLNDKEKEPSGSHGTSPISKATWQFMRKYLPQKINPSFGDIYTSDDTRPYYGYGCDEIPAIPPVDEEDPSSSEETKAKGRLLRAIFNTGKSQLQNIISLGGYNVMLKTMGYASKFKPEKSWVRLYQGQSHRKIGGGHRVKSIAVTDNWNEVKPLEETSTYGTNYSYERVEDQPSGERRIISSGVASYEPVSVGSDENSYRSPLNYSIDVKMRVNDDEFQEKMFGEEIFATSEVVYSQVEVKNRDYEGVTANKTGKTIYEFYTAKDFPSIVESTNRASNTKVKTKTGFLASLFTGKSKYHLAMSQGYSIQVNDMHGKFKGKKVVSSSGDDLPGIAGNPEIIYSMEHKYYQDGNRLKNDLNVVSQEGVVSSKFIGKDIDMVYDVHQSRSYNESTGLQFGIEVNAAVVIPSFWISNRSQDNLFTSSVTTKVVYSNGILSEIILQDKGREKRTQNLLFDENTGVPIVTKITHEAGPTSIPIYQYDYPAYWMYKGMGMASENWGAVFKNIADDNAKIILPDYTSFLNPGDEIIATDEEGEFEKYWVLEDETSNDYYLIDKFGDLADIESTVDYTYKVIRSGKRNLLGSTAASITSLNYDPNAYSPAFAHSQILNASAVEYTEQAFGYRSDKLGPQQTVEEVYQDLCGLVPGQKTNPYLQGLRANWNLLASYVFDGDRDQSADRIREDGVLAGYIEFWKNTAGVWGINPDSEVAQKWIKAAIATIFDREGYNLESRDALGIYSSILLGYNKTLKVAEAVNARYYEIGFDGFEDYGYDQVGDCTNPHFRFKNGELVMNPNFAHSGRHSLKVMPADYAYHESKIVNTINHTTSDHGHPYLVQAQELIGTHQFIIDEAEPRRFVLTAWVHEEKGDARVTSFDGAQIQIDIPSITDVVEKRSNIIDGWQRIEIEFTIPGEEIVSDITRQIRLKNESANNAVYFDDVRIQPFNSEMVSYVIDPISLRLWATLDSRNFATFYQYDEEGSLIRIIQETERGKVTVQENRAGIKVK